MRNTMRTGALIVGGGPAGLAPLIAASRSGTLSALLSAGVVVADQDHRIGAGRIGRYLINSDSSAETFLSCVVGNPDPRLAALADHPSALAIAPYGRGAVPLALVGDFLSAVGDAMAAIIEDTPAGGVMTCHEALSTRRLPEGGWSTRLRSTTTGIETDVVSRVVLLATGGHQPQSRLQYEPVAGRPLLPSQRGRLMQSDQVLTADGIAEIASRLEGVRHPRIVIVGGSTSAVSCARVLLASFGNLLQEGSVTLMHRRALSVFYPSAAAALADGYTAFGPDDICPVSGFVFRFGGLRFDSRELLMGALEIGDRSPDCRFQLHPLDAPPNNTQSAVASAADQSRSRQLLDQADLVISCLGYTPRALPVLDVDGKRLRLLAQQPGGRLVSSQCGVLDESGEELPGLFGIGLAAGFRPGKAMGGEPSFHGQVNGLWLWQNDVGALIARRMLGDVATSQTAASFWNRVETKIASSIEQASVSLTEQDVAMPVVSKTISSPTLPGHGQNYGSADRSTSHQLQR